METAPVPVGAHVPNDEPLRAAKDRGADIVQFFLSNPKSWKIPTSRPDADELAAADIDVYVHSPYLINVASNEPRVRHPSRKMLQETCDAATNIGAAAVIVHGGYCDEDEDISHGYTRWRKALAPLETTVPVFIENTAGGNNAPARHFDTLGYLWEEIADIDVPLGFCFDTCHAHAAGEDLGTAVERLESRVGAIDLVHCNDSRDEPGSGADRHTNLGHGNIDPDVLSHVLGEAAAPVIVETPGGVEDHVADITWIRQRL